MRRYTPSMPPRRLTTQRSLFIDSLTWTRDGSAVVYAAGDARRCNLWRVEVDGTRPPERIEVAGAEAHCASHRAVARPAGVHTRVRATPTSTASTSGVLCSWSLGRAVQERSARLSPDGRRLVFGSRGLRHLRGDLGRRGRRIESATAHARSRARSGLALLVTRWAPDRLRLVCRRFRIFTFG